MLKNGLGNLLLREAAKHSRFVDLFAGSGAVASYVATRVSVPVFAFDLQAYSSVLTDAVIGRTTVIDAKKVWKLWRDRAVRCLRSFPDYDFDVETVKGVVRARKWCEKQKSMTITSAYGGHYFSPEQASWIDALRQTLPALEPERTIALAALIDAASECAASPGHTAQPFQPTRSAKRYLMEAWSKSVSDKTRHALGKIALQHARLKGAATVCDANKAVEIVEKNDLVFIDPPYSALHYSRFYHVLETVATYHSGVVEGVGRYPAKELRPRSLYSVKSESATALESLLLQISKRNADVILTFPDHRCSNGLSGLSIKNIAKKYFSVTEKVVASQLSTLGGAGEDSIMLETRGARRRTDELILFMRPLKFAHEKNEESVACIAGDVGAVGDKVSTLNN